MTGVNIKNQKKIEENFPIKSQTSLEDKLALLVIRDLVGEVGRYNYLEIGSFLGGSLTPFILDSNCHHILSVDSRERSQPDERGCYYNYAGVSHDLMLSNIESHGLSIDKIEVFDGSINEYKNSNLKYDLVFIDGEHTDLACFRDFIYSFKLLNEDGVIIFHDSSLIYKSLQMIVELLKSRNYQFIFIKVKHSNVTALLLGGYSKKNLSRLLDIEENLEDFYRYSEKRNLISNVDNRVKVRLSFKSGIKLDVMDPPTKPAY